MKRFVMLLVTALFASGVIAEDKVIADFEGSDYGSWKTAGEAFGTAPAKGTLNAQQEVKGFKGHGLVNSYLKGDSTIGSLTSPEFIIEQNYINFLIGGGNHPGKTCINLLIDGKIVQTKTGINDEMLQEDGFNVSELKGKTATLQIVDEMNGGWGHINIDHIVQSDRKPKPRTAPAGQKEKKAPDGPPQSTEMVMEKNYLLFPIQDRLPRSRVTITVDDKPVRVFNAALATNADDVAFWSFSDMVDFKGKTAKIKINHLMDEGLKLIRQDDSIPGEDEFYKEPMRPQIHCSQKTGWNNDPNGMVYYAGEWHLFYQHNPHGWNWDNMHWGHCVSRDLVHWKELPEALYPWSMAKEHCFSGTAAVDWNNTSGFQTGKEKVLVAAFTDTGCGEALAYSNDKGRTWKYYENNPVLEHRGRDPKIIWHEPSQKWIMAVYDEDKERGKCIAFYNSSNLKEWEIQSYLPGFFECPEIFELPVDGSKAFLSIGKKETRWVVFAADAKYAIGRFDGKTFTPDHEGKHQLHHGAYYASQRFTDAPDGRIIQIGWGRINMKGMRFNQMLTFPMELSLRTTSEGIRLFGEPVKEIEKLYNKSHRIKKKTLSNNETAQIETQGLLFDIRAEFETGTAKTVGIDIDGHKIAVPARDGKAYVQVILDRPSMETIMNHGESIETKAYTHEDGNIEWIKAYAEGGEARLISLEVHELKSIWPANR